MRAVARVVASALTVTIALTAGTVQAGAAGVDLVSTDPADFTPRVTSGVSVLKMVQVGSLMYAGGLFSEVQSADRTETYDRNNFFAFDPGTGAVSSLDVNFNGAVWAIASSDTSLYIGGTFTTVNGFPRRAIVKIDATTGAVDPTFNANLNGQVKEAQVVSGRLIIGGEFPKRLAALDLATGADTGYINLNITGDVDGVDGWTPRVYRFAVDPAGTKLVAVGNFTSVAGLGRSRVFMADLGASEVTLNAWRYRPAGRMCRRPTLADYMRDAAFSPDGTYFVLISTGYVPKKTWQIGTSLCDAAARFETDLPNPKAPTWINYTGGDTLHSGIVTNDAVYVQGHQRWLDNPFGRDTCEGTCVSRPGIGAIDPVTGMALSWNPTKGRGEGGKDLYVTSQGLWVSSDTTTIGGEIHERLALLPGT